jgi:hypothetical protein
MFLGLIILLAFVVYYLWFEIFESGGYYPIAKGIRQLVIIILITSISGIYFSLSTIFGNKLFSEYRSLKLQNRILKMKIEQEGLIEDLEKK